MKTLTVSIAAYNVENFLLETLESLNDRRILSDVEVLIVNDGSTDNTEKIAQQYCERFPETFRLISKENGGHGSTINRGLREAKGKFFKVIDGDDLVDTELFVSFVERLKVADADIVFTSYCCIDMKGNRYEDDFIKRNGVNPYKYLIDNKVYNLSTDKIDSYVIGLSTLAIKTCLLRDNNVRITEHCYYVDIEFVMWCLGMSKSAIFYNMPLYLYRKDPKGNNSISKANMIKNVDMQKKVCQQAIKIYEYFTEKSLTTSHLNLLFERIINSVGATFRTYLLLNDSRQRVMIFDKSIKKESMQVWQKLEDDSFISKLRCCCYILTPFIGLLYKIYLLRKGKI